MRKQVSLDLPAYLADHHFMGKPVLPAVEIMAVLAGEVRSAAPSAAVTHITNARFEKFLYIDPEATRVGFFVDIALLKSGDIRATLLTRTRSAGAAITRTKVHADMVFSQTPPDAPVLPLDVAAAVEGVCRTVAAEVVYRDLVPFGPGYHTLASPVYLGDDGALAGIRCPAPGHPDPTLGSPFALDAAFHAACVWGQHRAERVAFPVAVGRRCVYRSVQPGEVCWARVLPRTVSEKQMFVNLWLMDGNGAVCEIAEDVEMRDPSGGRLRPPDWIRKGDGGDPLAALKHLSGGVSVIELDAVAPFATRALSVLETRRFASMGLRRRKSFIAAHLAAKRLFRATEADPGRTSADAIETVFPDTPLPRCPVSKPLGGGYCSLSHDRRFAVAVLSDTPVGVDVEYVANRVQQSAHLFLSENEQAVVAAAPLAAGEAATRAWSVKEAVAKATGIPFAATWEQVTVEAVSATESKVFIRNRGGATAVHAVVDGHLFTLFSLLPAS